MEKDGGEGEGEGEEIQAKKHWRESTMFSFFASILVHSLSLSLSQSRMMKAKQKDYILLLFFQFWGGLCMLLSHIVTHYFFINDSYCQFRQDHGPSLC